LASLIKEKEAPTSPDSKRSAASHVRTVFPQKPATHADKAVRAPFTAFGIGPAGQTRMLLAHYNSIAFALQHARRFKELFL